MHYTGALLAPPWLLAWAFQPGNPHLPSKNAMGGKGWALVKQVSVRQILVSQSAACRKRKRQERLFSVSVINQNRDRFVSGCHASGIYFVMYLKY